MINISQKAFGKYIRKTREQIGLSRDELAKKLLVTEDAVAKWENGKRIPDFITIANIANELGIQVQDIYDNSVEKNDEGGMMNKTTKIVVLFLLIFSVIGGGVLGFVKNSKEYHDSSNVVTPAETTAIDDNSKESTEQEIKKKIDLDKIRIALPESSLKKLDIRLGEYDESILAYFAGWRFESEQYEEPKHADGTDKVRYTLGGIGYSISEDMNRDVVYSEGRLAEVVSLMNHSSEEKIKSIDKDDFTALIYKYNMDMFTTVSYDGVSKMEHDYWYVFISAGINSRVYVAYFDADYFSLDDVEVFVDGIELIK